MKRGFTLIELLVVVLIIGILSAVALPQYQKAVAKTRIAGKLPMVDAFVKAQEEVRLGTGSYTTDLTALSIDVGAWNCASDSTGSGHCNMEHTHNMFWEVNWGSSGKIFVYCAAKTADSMAVSICKSYANGTDPVSSDNGYTYFIFKKIK